MTKLQSHIIPLQIILGLCSTGFGSPANQRPEFVASSIASDYVEARKPLEITATFTDADGDYIVDVQVSWRKIGTKGWSQKRMNYVKELVPIDAHQFVTEIHLTGEGDYEVEFRAADTSDTGKPIFGKSKWAGRKTFTSWLRPRNGLPKLLSNKTLPARDGRTLIIAHLKDPNPGDSVVDVKARWRRTGTEKWSEGTLNWVKATATPHDFQLLTKLLPGSYNLQFQAADVSTKFLNDTRKGRTEWIGGGTFEVPSQFKD